jgi:hypothetical protein
VTDRRDPILASQSPDVAALSSRRLPVLLRSAFVLLVLCGSVNAVAGLLILEEDEEDAVPANGARTFMISEQQFDQLVFGGQQQQVVQRVQGVPRAQVVRQVNGVQVIEVVQVAEVVQKLVPQSSIAEFRKRMENNASMEIETVARQVQLTEAQKKKLKLAARGDVEQFISRAEELRPKLTSKPIDQQQYVALMRELQPLRMSQQTGVIGENSLFRKTLRHCLTDEQRTRWQSLERERQRTTVESVLLTLERRPDGFKLTGESRRQFVDLIVEHGEFPETRNSYIHYVVLVEAGKLADRLKPLLHDDVWDKLQKQITQAQQVEATLRKSGQWPVRATDDSEELTDSAKE